jgi:hypothetical protein
MGGNDGESRRFHLVGMKTAILEPGLELALGLGVPCGTHGYVAGGRKDMRDVAAPHPARKGEAGWELRGVLLGGPVVPAGGRPDRERLLVLMLLGLHFYLSSWMVY